VVGARGVRVADWFPGTCRSDCYCTVRVAGEERNVLQTQTVSDQIEPLWHAEVTEAFPLRPGDALEFSIWDSISDDSLRLPLGSTERLVGMALLDSREFYYNGFNGELELDNLGRGITNAAVTVKVRRSDSQYPDPMLPEFVVHLQKAPVTPLGMDMDTQDGSVVFVNDVKEGIVQSYNDGANATERLQPGYFIVQANSVAGKAAEMVNVITEKAHLRLTVRRSLRMCVPICKKAKKRSIGLDFLKTSSAVACLVITSVKDGLVQDWNFTNPEKSVLAGDRIIAVNGKEGRASDLIKKLRELNKFVITIVRVNVKPPRGVDILAPHFSACNE